MQINSWNTIATLARLGEKSLNVAGGAAAVAFYLDAKSSFSLLSNVPNFYDSLNLCSYEDKPFSPLLSRLIVGVPFALISGTLNSFLSQQCEIKKDFSVQEVCLNPENSSLVDAIGLPFIGTVFGCFALGELLLKVAAYAKERAFQHPR